MKYSYTHQRKKSPITAELQLLLTFFSITVFMLIATYGFLLFQDYRFEGKISDISQERFDLNITTYEMNSKITFIEKQNLLCERIYTKNTVLKDSITNMFDLVPSRITLSEASLLEDGLILSGITPNKDVYNFMLQAPLRSIFHRTYSSFYPAENGWLRFVSTNYIDNNKDEEINDED